MSWTAPDNTPAVVDPPHDPCDETQTPVYCESFVDTGDVVPTKLTSLCSPDRIEMNVKPKLVDVLPEFLIGCGEGGLEKFPASLIQPVCYEATYGPIDPDAPVDSAYHFNADNTEKLEQYDLASNCMKPVLAPVGSQVKYTKGGVPTLADFNGDVWVEQNPSSNLDCAAVLACIIEDPAALTALCEVLAPMLISTSTSARKAKA